MNHIYLRGQIEAALKSQWPVFAKDHPHLANVLDQEVLIEEMTESLRHDQAFNEALVKAQACGMGISAVIGLVSKWVTDRLQLL